MYEAGKVVGEDGAGKQVANNGGDSNGDQTRNHKAVVQQVLTNDRCAASVKVDGCNI